MIVKIRYLLNVPVPYVWKSHERILSLIEIKNNYLRLDMEQTKNMLQLYPANTGSFGSITGTMIETEK
jgi:hypothetical protein